MNDARAETEKPFLVISDVDDTLTGDEQALRTLVAVLEENRETIRFALNSSRPSASVDRTLETDFPPGFEAYACITAMGTEIRIGGQFVRAWCERFEGWPRDEIHSLVAAMGYRPHAEEFQTRFKVSFAVPRSAHGRVRSVLKGRGIECRFIASGTDDLDIIPLLAGKDHASTFLAELLGIPAGHVIVAGDSLNDLAMFEVASRAVAVGNARLELLEAMPVNKTYRANGHHAAGVLEGLRHFGIVSG